MGQTDPTVLAKEIFLQTKDSPKGFASTTCITAFQTLSLKMIDFASYLHK